MKIKIAIAGDNTLVRDTLSKIFKSFEFEICLVAESGVELLNQIEVGIFPDICIVDSNMPVINGFETSYEIKERWPFIKTIILVSKDATTVFKHQTASGADALLLQAAGLADCMKVLLALTIDIRDEQEDRLITNRTHFLPWILS